MSTPVAINARAAARAEIGGVERVAREMSTRLPRLWPERYRVLAPPRALAHRAGHAWEQLALPVLARGSRLIYSPANLAPLAGRRAVVVIHDLAPFHDPAWYGRAYGTYHRSMARLLARRARLVICDSAFVAGEMAERLDVPEKRLRVVPLGVDAARWGAGEPSAAARELGLEGAYVLAVGTDVGRKNLGVLDRQAERLRAAGLEPVVAGSGRSYMPAGSTTSRGARRLGYVPDHLLPGLYAGAAAFAMPSLYEGFGLPCLEAMAAGTPVVAADASSLPETCGSAATLVPPGDDAAFGDAVVAAATPGPGRDALIAAGRERAAELSWDRTAERTDAVLSELL